MELVVLSVLFGWGLDDVWLGGCGEGLMCCGLVDYGRLMER